MPATVRVRALVPLVLALLPIVWACTPPPAPAAPACRPRAGFEPARSFRAVEDCGRSWLVTPAGDRFLSFGVNHVSWNGDHSPAANANPYADAVRARYGTEDAWAEATAARLREWGWNTVGAWSSHASMSKHLPHTVMLSLAGADWLTGRVPDYFDPAWEAAVNARAEERMRAFVDDPNLVGWFLDNELRWGPDWRGGTTLFEDYFAMPAHAPGKAALVAILRERHEDAAHFDEAWGTAFGSFDAIAAATKLPAALGEEARADRSAFLRALAKRFFEVTTHAVRSRDPEHLVLGVRFVASMTPREVVEVAGRSLDVVSVNAYEYALDPAAALDPEEHGFVDAAGGFLEGFYRASGRPVLVGEFGFRAADSGLPNSWPPFYPTLATQAERADRFEAYARRCLEAPWIVGYHWFEYVDQPPTGRFDGEDNNWGLVDVNDDPWTVLVERTRAVNRLEAARR